MITKDTAIDPEARSQVGPPGLVEKDRQCLPLPAGEIELLSDPDVIADPFMYSVKKLIEIRRSYEPRFGNFRLPPIVRRD